MIEKMTKWNFVLLSGETAGFLAKLQELGVVDVVRSSKSPDSRSLEILEKISKDKEALRILSRYNLENEADKASISEIMKEEYPDPSDVPSVDVIRIDGEIAGLNEHLKELRKEVLRRMPWGEFDSSAVARLEKTGLQLHYYTTDKFDPAWEELVPLEIISQEGSKTWFVTVSRTGEPYSFPLVEAAAPEGQWKDAEAEIASTVRQVNILKARIYSMKEQTAVLIEKDKLSLESALDLHIAGNTALKSVDNLVSVFEGFAPSAEDVRLAGEFDKLDVYYEKDAARDEDNPPIKLRNNAFIRLFEPLTGMYGFPDYGEFDPTPVLGPFFLLFFSLCMGDGGYGILLFLLGLALHKKWMKIEMFDGFGPIIMALGVGTFFVGTFLGTFFGMNIKDMEFLPEAFRNCLLSSDVQWFGYSAQMVLAVFIGVFHICLARIIKTAVSTVRFGFKESISTWGWTLLIVGGVITATLAATQVLSEEALKIVVIVIGVVSALGIYIFNKIGRNPLINIGAGLWDTYNEATGLLGDVLSYIRLYALGLAGGMLGGAFNDLANMVVAVDNPTWHYLPFVLILLLGHLLNLALSGLGAFVHPLRLTFVEYFKNSGYEGRGLRYNPLKKN
ncbi:MAG: ATPase V [Bacteroidales bacterium]|nr:ATPase V [Bacteroidales bacterium]